MALYKPTRAMRTTLHYERFAHLVPRPGQKDAITTVFPHEDLKKKVIIWSERSKHFYVFDTVKQLELFLEVEPDQHYYEVVFGWKRQKPKFDVDTGTEKDFDELVAAVKKVIGAGVRIIITDSSSSKKFSRHIIVDKYVKDVEAAKEIMEKVVKIIGDKNLDTLVYKSTQYFRLLGSRKISGETKRVISPKTGVSFKDTLIGKY